MAILDKAQKNECLTINIGSDVVYDILTLAKTIIKITNSNSDITFLPPLKEGDMSRRQPCIKKDADFFTKTLNSIRGRFKNYLL